MEHIQNQFAGSRIQGWELEHKVVRVIRGGCEYVQCVDFDIFNAMCEKDKAEQRAQMIAEAQAAAYLGGAE